LAVSDLSQWRWIPQPNSASPAIFALRSRGRHRVAPAHTANRLSSGKTDVSSLSYLL